MKRLWQRLIPPHIRDQIDQADAHLADARDAFTRVAQRDQRINQLVHEHRIDRARNHYGERIAAALGRQQWT